MKNKKYVIGLCLVLLVFLADACSAKSVTLVTGQRILSFGEKITVQVTTDSITSYNITVVNSTGDVLKILSPLLPMSDPDWIPGDMFGMSDPITPNLTFMQKGNYSVIVANLNDTSNTITHSFTVVDPYSFRILLLENNTHGAKTNVIIPTPNAVSVGIGYAISDVNVTKSGIIYYGNTSESSFGCDIDGDGLLTTTVHVRITDPVASGNYTQVFMDDDNLISEAAETGKPPRTFLGLNDFTLKCTNYTDLAPFIISHVYQGGVYLALPPGPGDLPYALDSNITLEVFAYDNRNSTPVSAGINAVLRFKLPSATTAVWSESSLNSILARVNSTALSDSTGANGKSNAVSFNTAVANLTAGEYAVVVNDIAVQTFKIATSWDARVILGDPITKTDKYDFSLNDPVGVGITTDAQSPTITVSVYNPNGSIEASWFYNGTNYANGIAYDSAFKMYVAGLDSSLNPLLSATQTGRWTVDVVVSSGSDEKKIDREFEVKAFEVNIAPLAFYGDEPEPKFGVFKPNGVGYIGIFAMKFGVRGDLRKNIQAEDLINIEDNYTDNLNVCANAVLNLSIRDSQGNTHNHSAIDNIHKMLVLGGRMVPEQFRGQCMANFTVPGVSGEYFVDVTLNTSSGTASATEKFTVTELDSWCEPWDTLTNNYRWHFSPEANVTLRIRAENIYTGSELPAEDVQIVELSEIFSPDQGGTVTDTIEGYGFSKLNVSNSLVPVLWIKLSNKTSGFHDVSYRIKVRMNASGVVKNVTGTGGCGFETKLYDIVGHPDFSLGRNYFRPDEAINFTVEVRSPDGPVSNAYAYIEELHKSGVTAAPGEINFTATRGTTDSGGMAAVTISLRDGEWEPGSYDVRIRVKDSQGKIDYGHGWFEIKSFQMVFEEVEVNGSLCVISSKDGGGGTAFTGENGYILIYGINQTGIFAVDLVKDKSHLFQFTNLNGEPIFRDIKPIPLSDTINCTLARGSSNTSARYFIINTTGLGGEFDLEVVARAPGGSLGTSRMHFTIMPFQMDFRLDFKGEPVFKKGDTLTFNITTDSDYNITNATVLRIVSVGREERILPIPSGNITAQFTTPVGHSRKLDVVIPESPLIVKGEYVMQIQVEVTKPGGEKSSLVGTQFFIIKLFTYAMAMIKESWTDTYSTSDNRSFNFWDFDSVRYDPNHWNASLRRCPFPSVLNYTTEPCGLISRAQVRARLLEIWDQNGMDEQYNSFVEYYNQSGRNITLFKGFYMIVGSLDSEKIDNAKVYLARNSGQLYWSNLTGYSVGDIIYDESGMAFKISDIQREEVLLTPVSFARIWSLRSIKVNLTNASLSGEIRIGALREGDRPEDWMDFNANGLMDGRSGGGEYGLPFVLTDKQTSGIYDTVLVDSDMDLDLTDEHEIGIGEGVNLPLLNKTIYLIKADQYQTLFAFNEPGRDNWLGQHRKNYNITAPIYAPVEGLNVSVLRIDDVFARSPLDPSNYTAYSSVVNNSLAFLKVNIAKAGQYQILYQMADANGSTDVPEPWMTPSVEVKAFDSRWDLVENAVNIGAFFPLNGAAVRLQGMDERGRWQEWVDYNGTQLELALATLPDGFRGVLNTGLRFQITHGDPTLYMAFDRNLNKIYVSSVSTNFTGISGKDLGQVVYTVSNLTVFPGGGPGSEQDPKSDFNITLSGKQCWDEECQLIFEVKQPVLVPIFRQTGGRCGPIPDEEAGEFKRLYNMSQNVSGFQCMVDFDVPFGGPLRDSFMQIYNITGVGLRVLVTTNVSSEDGMNVSDRFSIAINETTGLPSFTEPVNVSGDLNDQWCWGGGCPGGEYEARIQILNVSLNSNPGDGPYTIWFRFSETLNESHGFRASVRKGEVNLVGPSPKYYVTSVGWKGIWAAIDVSNETEPVLYIDSDANFTGVAGYRQGEDIPVYDKFAQANVLYNIQYLAPRFYGNYTFGLNETKMFYGGKKIKLLEIMLNENRTRWEIIGFADDPENPPTEQVECSIEGCGRQDMDFMISGMNETHAFIYDLRDIAHRMLLGFNTSGLDAETRALFNSTGNAYEKRIGSASLGGVDYNVMVLDTNGTWEDRNFNKVIISNDTTLTADEVVKYGNTSLSVNGYYISYLDPGGGEIVLIQNTTNVLGVPVSRDNAGYLLNTVSASKFPAPLNNTLNYVFIAFDDNDRDGVARINQMVFDDDNNWINMDCENTGGESGGMLCLDENPLTGAVYNESGIVPERWVWIPQKGYDSWVEFQVKNTSTGRFGGDNPDSRISYMLWQSNLSTPIWLMKRMEWWNTGLNSSSNITITVRVNDFKNNPLSGALFNITELTMMGEFGGEWMEVPAGAYVSYTINYSPADQRMDDSGMMIIVISPVNGTWPEKDYEVRFTIAGAGDLERGGVWFHVGRFMSKGSGGGESPGKVEACDSIINQTICANMTGKCSWDDSKGGDCVPAATPIYCQDYKDQGSCASPCFWVTPQGEDSMCISCNMIGDSSKCSGVKSHGGPCDWFVDGGVGECIYTGGGG